MRDLDDIKAIKEIDKSRMLEILCNFPTQCEEAERIGEDFDAPGNYRNFDKIVFTGLGGSAISGDLAKSYLSGEISVPIVVNRDYLLPEFVDTKTLVFAISYSGNTEETLSAYAEAKRKKARIIVLTSGGELLAEARKDGIPSIVIPSGLPPRTALGYLFFPVLCVLSKLGLIGDKKSSVRDTLGLLRRLKDGVIGPDLPKAANIAKDLALKIYDKFPVMYGASSHMEAVVTRWRTQLAENSKVLSSLHLFPEMNHNEIVGWENPRRLLKDFLVIILRDDDEHHRVKRRIEITESIIEKQKVCIKEVWSEGEDLLSRLFSLIYIGDFVSFYLAVLNDVDPTPVERIDYLKKQLQ